MPRPGRHVPDACARAPRRTRGALGGGERRSAMEDLTIRGGACWALAEDGAPGPPASVAPPLLRLGHLEAQETWGSRETPANTHRAGLDGRRLSSGSVWLRGDVDEDRRCAWLSASAPSAKSGPCGGRSRATTGAICASGVCVVVPRTVLLRSSQGFEGYPGDHPPYLKSKGRGDNSMAGKQEVKRRRRNHRPARSVWRGESCIASSLVLSGPLQTHRQSV